MSWTKRALWFLTRESRTPYVFMLSVTEDWFINPMHVGLADAMEASGLKVHRDIYTPAWSVERVWAWEKP